MGLMHVTGYARFCLMICGACAWLAGQGLTTKASKEDWEEINFAFNSSVLSDGYPSLLRLVDLLIQNAGYSVKVYGHTDSIGPDSVNNALSSARAEAVKGFLLRLGVRPGQIQAIGRGKLEPEASNDTKEGRFMNRRVKIVVTDEKGRGVGESSLGARLRPVRTPKRIEPPATKEVRQATSSAEAGSPTCFAVQLGAFREWANADRLRELVGRSSFRTEIRPSRANPPLWKVVVGCEATRDAAQEVARRLAGNSDSALIVSLYNPAARQH